MVSEAYTGFRWLPENTLICAWKLEIGGCIAALLSLFAILSTLFPHANNPLPQWPLNVSINTLLSIYAVVFKVSIASVLSTCIAQLQWTWFSTARPLGDLIGYNDASRGAWGSLLWLLSYRLHDPLTAFAALLMILSLAIDPFVQQLVSPRDCETTLRQLTATLPRTNSLDNADDDFFSSWIIDALSPSTSGSSFVDSSLVCPTGNCTFPTEYSTLAYCSSCLDVSDKVSILVEGTPETQENYTTTLQVPEGYTTFETKAWLSTANKTLSTNMTFLGAEMAQVVTLPEYQGVLSDVEVFVAMGANYYTARGWDPATTDELQGRSEEDAHIWGLETLNGRHRVRRKQFIHQLALPRLWCGSVHAL